MSATGASSVVIMGQSYQLSVPDGRTDDLLRAAETVNNAMCQIRDAGKVKARSHIAVLAALNIAYENLKPSDEIAAQAAANSNNTTAGKTASETEQMEEQLQQRITGLITRLDDLLGEDGRLL